MKNAASARLVGTFLLCSAALLGPSVAVAQTIDDPVARRAYDATGRQLDALDRVDATLRPPVGPSAPSPLLPAWPGTPPPPAPASTLNHLLDGFDGPPAKLPEPAPAPAPAPVVAAPMPAKLPIAEPAADGVETAPVTRMRQDDAVALVIGVERYRGTLPPADFAEADAKLYARYLERTLGVKRENIRLLVGDRASKSDIEAALDEWLPKHAKAGAPVYFYFSGHGAPDPQSGDSYLVPWDGEPEYLKSQALLLPRVYAALAKSRGRVLAVVDSCFSGLGGHSVLARGLRPLVPVREVVPQSGTLAVLSAASSTQVTGAARSAPHGLFTFHVLRGLAGAADRDGDRVVSLHELELFVRRNVETDAREQAREQSPKLHLTGAGKPGDWVVVDGLVE